MAFRYVAAPTFSAEVGISVPGQPEPAPLKVLFRHKGLAEFAQWTDSHKGRADVDILMEIIDDLPELEDADGKPAKFSREVLARLLNDYPAASLEIARGYRSALQDSRAKN